MRRLTVLATLTLALLATPLAAEAQKPGESLPASSRTAKALGLTIPAAVLARADEVIE